MLGQCYANEKFNVIILAGGAGSRMGQASEFIPKALTKVGEFRAIDLLISRYLNISHRLIIRSL